MAHGIAEIWRPVPDHAGLGEWELTPRSFWNLGVRLGGQDEAGGPPTWPIIRTPVSSVPFDPKTPPVVIEAQGAQIRQWQLVANSAGPPPPSPVTTELPIIGLRLKPYGSARLRVSELPTVIAH